MPVGGGANGRHRAPMSTRTAAATPSGRGNLGRELIIAEAVRFIDQSGEDRLTMRRLGAELNVEAMALYRYVPGREQLLDGIVEYVMNELYDATMTGELTSSWQEYLQQTARGVRTVATAHPRIFPMVAVRPPAAPWLRPPLRSLRWVESFLDLGSRLSRACWSIVPLPRSCSVTCCSRLPRWSGTKKQRSRVALQSRTPRSCRRTPG